VFHVILRDELTLSSKPLIKAILLAKPSMGGSADLNHVAHYSKLVPDHGSISLQFNYTLRLHNGSDISRDLNDPACFFKLAANQGHAEAQFNYGLFLQNGSSILRD
jgi:TPR repeat protein